MGYLKIFRNTLILLCCFILLNTHIFATEKNEQQLRAERLSVLIKTFSLDKKEADDIKSSITETSQSFWKLLDAKSEFEKNYQSGEVKNKLEELEEYKKSRSKLLDEYSSKVSTLMRKLDKHFNDEQIVAIYRFLYDELWYEGFVTESSVEVKETIRYFSEPTFDSTSLISQYTYEELEEMEEEYIEGENEALHSDMDPPETMAIVRETVSVVSRPPVSVEHESQVLPKLPPWHDFPPPPATTFSIQDLLVNQSLPALKYYWLELAPLADSVASAASKDK